MENANRLAAGRGITLRAELRDTKLDPATALSSAELVVITPYVAPTS